MPDITFRTAWAKSDSELVRDARSFWLGIGGLSPDQIETRAKELSALAYADRQVAAVSTVHLFDLPRPRARFFYYRTTVAPGFRSQRLASRLCVHSRDRVAEWARANPEAKVMGLFIVIEAARPWPDRSASNSSLWAICRAAIKCAWYGSTTQPSSNGA